jgi:hypothetical protein
VQELDFTFMIFQAYPQKELLYYWVDGEKVKRTMRRQAFYDLIDSKFPELRKEAYDAAITYSFYILSAADRNITHLVPKSDDTPYKDNLNALIHGKAPRIVKESTSIQDILMGYGFNAPNALTVQNLQATLQKKEPEEEGFLARFLTRRRTPIKQPPKNPTK